MVGYFTAGIGMGCRFYLRLALGSATVAAMTTAGIVAPIIATTGVSPELMVIATGAGSVIFLMNDPGILDLQRVFQPVYSGNLQILVNSGNPDRRLWSGRNTDSLSNMI